MVSAWTEAKNPSRHAPAARRDREAIGTAWRRTKFTAAAAKSRKIGMAKTWAWRSAKVRLQRGYSLIVSRITREVAQK